MSVADLATIFSFFVVIASSSAFAQVASSPSYALDGYDFGGSGGGESSVGYATANSIAFPTGARATSTNYQVTYGFLAGFDPQPTNAPVIFGVMPSCGPLSGGNPLLVSGVNFDKFGAGPTVTVTIDGNAAIGVNVQSDTQIRCSAPAGLAGPKDFTVTNSNGADTVSGGYEYTGDFAIYGTGTPGCAGAETTFGGTCPHIGNTGFTIFTSKTPADSLGLLLVTDSQDVSGSDPFALGILLHVDFFLATEVFAFDIYSDSTGLGSALAPIPNDVGLVGNTYYAQSIWVETSCVLPPLQLSSSRGLSITIEL